MLVSSFLPGEVRKDLTSAKPDKSLLISKRRKGLTSVVPLLFIQIPLILYLPIRTVLDALIASITGSPAPAYCCAVFSCALQQKDSKASSERSASCLAPAGSSLKSIRFLLFLFNVSSIIICHQFPSENGSLPAPCVGTAPCTLLL